MPLFFLDVCNRDISAEDLEGRDLPNLEAAFREAIVGIRSILGQELAEGRLDLCGEIRIRNGQGEVLQVVPYADALEIKT
jgi:hypothetical protein